MGNEGLHWGERVLISKTWRYINVHAHFEKEECYELRAKLKAYVSYLRKGKRGKVR